MTRLRLPLTVRHGARSIDLMLEAAGPVPWSRAHPWVLRAAGLPAQTPLYLGIGPVQPDWPTGSPPLLSGCLLDTTPAASLPDDPAVVLAVIAGPDAGRCVPIGRRPICVGRDPRADLPLTDPQASFRHALLRPTVTGLAVTDLGSTNGVLVDGTTAAETSPAGTGSLIRIGGSLLQVQLAATPPGQLIPDHAGHLLRPAAPPSPIVPLPPVPDPPGPPPQRQRRPIPLLSALVGAAVGATLALVLGSAIYLAFAALGPLTILGSALSDRIAGRRSFRTLLAEHRQALAAWEAAAADRARADRRQAWDLWPDPATVLRRVAAGSPRLWERHPDDEAYWRLAVGSGTRLTRPSGGPGPHRADEARPAVRVTDVPVTVDLAVTPVLGIAGAGSRAVLRWLILQLASQHSPADVALLLMGPRRDLRPARDLPHVIDGPEDAGNRDLVVVLDGPAAGTPLADALLAGARRGIDAHPSESSPRPASEHPGASPPIGPPVDPTAPNRRLSVLCVAGRAEDLPDGCTMLVTPRATGVPGAVGPVDLTGIGADRFELACRELAPLRESAGRSRPLARRLPLTDLIGAVDPAAVGGGWRQPTPRAVLGAGTDGPTTLDLDADGPHLLIAGTTGSGKSELLLTLIAALAVACPPRALTFLLVDYKGGSAFRSVSELPHVVGVVTDLDPALSGRALASLRAELRRRERISATGGPAPPRLVLVIDEFATLAAELPEFLAGVLDIAQRGRSLGLHLVLATQRPAGVVSPAVRANISARICLRVTDPADSVDVIAGPDAARIPAHLPGRGLLRTGAGLREFQSALVSIPVPALLRVWRRDALSGPQRPRGPSGDGAGPTATAHSTPPTVLAAVVAAARQAAAGQRPPDRPWLPPLPDRFVLGPGQRGCLALADLPDEQSQRELALPDTSVLVVGPPGSGRSTTLRRIATIVAGRGCELLVVDSAGSLSDLRGWPAVSTLLGLDEPRLVLRLLTLLSDAARRPADGRQRYLLLDGYDVIAAALDRADYTLGSTMLTELPARSAGSVRLIVTGPPTLLHQRIAGATRSVIELGAPGSTVPGRGSWSGSVIQIADAPPGSGPEPAPPGVAAPWPDPLVVRPLPRRVHLGALPAPRPDAVPLGLGGDAAGPITVDLAGPGGALVVTGPRGSGVRTALRVLARGAQLSGIPVLRVETGGPATAIGPGGSTGALDASGVPGPTVIDLAGGTEPLRAALAAHSGPLLLVVDQTGLGDEHPAADLLQQFCRGCGPGQHLLLGARPQTVARARYGHPRAALAFRRGLLLAPDPSTAPPWDVAIPRRAGPVPPGRGLWVQQGRGTPVQVADPGPLDERASPRRCEPPH